MIVTPSINSVIQTGLLSPPEYRSLSIWITESQDLPKISGIKSFELSTEELQAWFESAVTSVVVKLDGTVIGMATLTREEAELAETQIEICHIVVHPDYRRLYNGTSIIVRLISFAKSHNYKTVVARVVKDNIIAQELFHSLRWEKMTKNLPNNDPSVKWYQKKIWSNG